MLHLTPFPIYVDKLKSDRLFCITPEDDDWEYGGGKTTPPTVLEKICTY